MHQIHQNKDCETLLAPPVQQHILFFFGVPKMTIHMDQAASEYAATALLDFGHLHH